MPWLWRWKGSCRRPHLHLPELTASSIGRDRQQKPCHGSGRECWSPMASRRGRSSECLRTESEAGPRSRSRPWEQRSVRAESYGDGRARLWCRRHSMRMPRIRIQTGQGNPLLSAGSCCCFRPASSLPASAGSVHEHSLRPGSRPERWRARAPRQTPWHPDLPERWGTLGGG